MAKKEVNYPDVKNPKQRAMLQALEKTLGVVSSAVKQVGIARSTHYEWLDQSSKTYSEPYAREVHAVKDVALDFVESQMFQKIQGVKVTTADGQTAYKRDPDATCIIFYLKTQGKNRGYIERVQTEEISDREPIEVHIIDPHGESNSSDNKL